ncbi:unnamed protein product [Orchesella dallaii]|uniref:Odorant receptor n=1 Tax=Orchesella dallaii TaxID=48710 RepID=A0ABP1QC24_9HEXA
MLNDSQRFAFGIYNFFTFCMPPLPITWDENYDGIHLRVPGYKSIPYAISSAFVLFVDFWMIYSMCWHGFIKPHPDYGLVDVSILLIMITATTAGYYIAAIAFRNVNDNVTGFNELIYLNQNIVSGFSQVRYKDFIEKQSKKENKFGHFLCTLVAALNIFPFVVTPITILSNYDFVNIDDVLTDPMYRPISEIVIGLVVPPVIVLLFFLEICRNASFLTALVVISAGNFLTITDSLLYFCEKMEHNTFYSYYIQASLIYRKMESLISSVFYVGMATTFWIVVAGAWLSVKGKDKMPPIIHSGIVVVIGILVLVCVIVLPKMANACDNQITLVIRFEQHVVKSFDGSKKTRQNLIQVKRAKTIIPVRIRYGSFYKIGKAFIVQYFEVMLLRSLDSILILN